MISKFGLVQYSEIIVVVIYGFYTNMDIVFHLTAPHVEFTKPLTDVEVKEKESAKFECEVSRESAKVCTFFL